MDSAPTVIPSKEYTLLRNYNCDSNIKVEVNNLYGKYEESTHITTEYFIGSLMRKPDFYSPDRIRRLALEDIEAK